MEKNCADAGFRKTPWFFWWHVFVEMYSLERPKKNVDFGILEFLKTAVFCFQNKKNRMKRHMKCSPPPGEWFDFLELGQFVEIPKPYTPKKCFSHVSFQCVKRNWTQAMPVSKPMPSCLNDGSEIDPLGRASKLVRNGPWHWGTDRKRRLSHPKYKPSKHRQTKKTRRPRRQK